MSPLPNPPPHAGEGVPAHAPGLRIGLLGGSFNPPHVAHRAISLLALKRLRLDRVWWLVSPGNPLKETRGLPPLSRRIAEAAAVARHPRIRVTGIEAAIGTSYTYETLAWLKARCHGVRFVWIMGADNLAEFHRWRNWRGIAAQVPMAVIDRAEASLQAVATPAGQALARWRIPESRAVTLAGRKPPAWVFLHGYRSPLSSTAIRRSSVRRGG